MRNDLLDEAVEMIRAAGFEPCVVRNRHWKVHWADQQGRRHCLVVAFSPATAAPGCSRVPYCAGC
jgi:hypothetical protein